MVTTRSGVHHTKKFLMKQLVKKEEKEATRRPSVRTRKPQARVMEEIVEVRAPRARKTEVVRKRRTRRTHSAPARASAKGSYKEFVAKNINRMKGATPQLRMAECARLWRNSK